MAQSKIAWMAAAILLCGCKEHSEPLPGETYRKKFIEVFGDIDPYQDWNLAERALIEFELPDTVIDEVSIQCRINGARFNLGTYYQISNNMDLYFDMPKDIDKVYVVTKDNAFEMTPYSKFTLGGAIPVALDASEQVEEMRWLMVAEDLGDTGDFDFNDFIAQITVPTPTPILVDGSVHDWEHGGEDTGDLSRSIESDISQLDHHVVIKAMAAGGTLKLWLHYFDGVDDYIIGPGNNNGYIRTNSIINELQADMYEWHEWFYKKYPEKITGYNYNYTTMLNTDYVYSDGRLSNIGEGITIALPINDGYFNDGTVIRSDFTIEKYSEILPSPTEQYKFKIDKGFYITVRDYKYDMDGYGKYYELGQIIGHPNMGSAPQMFLIPDRGSATGGWEWPVETKNITAVYQGFLSWCKDRTNTHWYLQQSGSSTNYHHRD